MNNNVYRKEYNTLKEKEIFSPLDFTKLGSLPGLGTAGLGVTYERNLNELKKYVIKSNIINDNFEPNTECIFIGLKFPMPILPSPMSGIETNLANIITEYNFIDKLFDNCNRFGCLGLCGDSNDSTNNYIVPELIKKYGGIATCKPRENEEIVDRIIKLEKSGASAIGLDLDGLGGVNLFKNKKVFLKGKNDLKYIREKIHVPAFLKGITSLEDARIAYELGYDGIIISNHGGRSIDYLPSTLEVLKQVSSELKGKISIGVDGCVFSGYDAFVYLANGADMVFSGRAVLYSLLDSNCNSVFDLLSQYQIELKKSMLFTNCKCINDIRGDKIYERNN